MRMRFRVWLSVVLFVPSVASGAPEALPSRSVERVVAFVDGDPVWLTDLRRGTLTLRKQLAALPREKRARARRDLFVQLLDREIERKLIAKEAHTLGVAVQKREIDAALSGVAKQNGVDKKALLAAVQKEGMTEAVYRSELSHQLLEAKLLRMRMARLDRDRAANGSLEEQLDQSLKRLEAERTRWIQELRRKSHIALRVQP
jgi:parvulin-like peptidyl-prolyl isomerase